MGFIMRPINVDVDIKLNCITVISQCPQKLRRTFDFNELDPHFQLTIDDIEGRKANKALQGSIDIYEGRRNQDVNIFIKCM